MVTTTHQTLDTIYNADSVEWCPVPGLQDLLLCGTYQLEDQDSKVACGRVKSGNFGHQETESSTPQVRVGRLYLYRLQLGNGCLGLDTVWEKDMPGILDIKWCHTAVNGLPCFGLVNSVGQLQLYSIDERDGEATLVTETQLCDKCLGLALDWNNVLDPSLEPKIVTSDSSGGVAVYSVGTDGVEQVRSWKAHDFEAWIAAFNHWDHNIVFTGGDDCLLKKWDLRADLTQPVLTSKRHTMGVCSIQTSPHHDYLLATGSYDEQLLVWDSRQMKRPITEIGLGGGIWRIKWEPSTGDKILTATMYNGFHIIDTSSLNDDHLKIVKHFEEHKSIGYGADWCRLLVDNETQTLKSCEPVYDSTSKKYNIATCSFYDHTLKLWDFQDLQE